MGKRGVLPKCDKVTSINSRRPQKVAPRIVVAEPHCPKWLTGEARREWKRVVPELVRLKLLASIDRALLVSYCKAWAYAQEARKRLDAEGLTVVGDRGQTSKHPCWTEWTQASNLVVAYGRQLGLTPDARLRSAKPETDDDAEDDLD